MYYPSTVWTVNAMDAMGLAKSQEIDLNHKSIDLNHKSIDLNHKPIDHNFNFHFHIGIPN